MWYIKHLIPRIHWTKYKEDGDLILHIWRQWLWFCYDETYLNVGKAEMLGPKK